MPSTVRVRVSDKAVLVTGAIRNPLFPMTLDLPIMGRSTPILGLWRKFPTQRQLTLGLGEKGAGDLREGAARRGDQQRTEMHRWLEGDDGEARSIQAFEGERVEDRKSTRLNSSH